MVNTQGIVEDQVVHKFSIEDVRILEQPHMVINEFFLDGSVESFHVSVHLRGLGVGVIMSEMEPLQFCGKMLLELRAVIGKHKKEVIGMRECLLAQSKELGGSQGCMTFRAPGK